MLSYYFNDSPTSIKVIINENNELLIVGFT